MWSCSLFLSLSVSVSLSLSLSLSLCLARSQDGTVILWQYESGRELQSWDMRKLRGAPGSTKEGEEEEKEEEEKVTNTSHTFPITSVVL